MLNAVHHRQPSAIRTARRGYTLIEMMIVIVILITLIAIFAPVIGGARNAARTVATRQLVTNLQASSASFELDQRRLPGYFTQAQMGDPANRDRGFSNMQNIMLDLSGGVVATNNATALTVGPTATNTAFVRLDLINAPTEAKGVTKNVYFTIDKKNWVAHTAAQKEASIQHHRDLPDVVDAFSNPLLVWIEDDGAGPNDVFAAAASSTRAHFYWNSNAAFLRSTALGRGAKNQADAVEGSMLTPRAGLALAEIELSMNGVLGHPAFPAPQANVSTPPVPATARGKIVFHSAGADGVFLGARDRGGLIATSTNPGGTPPHRTNVIDYRGGKSDPLDNFDDIITVGGN